MKKKRVVRIKKKTTLPKREELKATANALGMTVKEYVDWQAQLHRDHTGKRNRSAYLDLGPEVYNIKTGLYDRKKKKGNKE